MSLEEQLNKLKRLYELAEHQREISEREKRIAKLEGALRAKESELKGSDNEKHKKEKASLEAKLEAAHNEHEGERAALRMNLESERKTADGLRAELASLKEGYAPAEELRAAKANVKKYEEWWYEERRAKEKFKAVLEFRIKAERITLAMGAVLTAAGVCVLAALKLRGVTYQNVMESLESNAASLYSTGAGLASAAAVALARGLMYDASERRDIREKERLGYGAVVTKETTVHRMVGFTKSHWILPTVLGASLSIASYLQRDRIGAWWMEDYYFRNDEGEVRIAVDDRARKKLDHILFDASRVRVMDTEKVYLLLSRIDGISRKSDNHITEKEVDMFREKYGTDMNRALQDMGLK